MSYFNSCSRCHDMTHFLKNVTESHAKSELHDVDVAKVDCSQEEKLCGS